MYADPYVDPAYGGQTVYGGPVAGPVMAGPVTYIPTTGTRGGYASRFVPMNACACLLALAIFAIEIAASIVCWYRYEEFYTATTLTGANGVQQTFNLNRTDSCYDLTGVSSVAGSATATTAKAATFREYDASSSVWSTMKLCQAFTIIALILAGLLMFFLLLCFAPSVRNRLLFTCGMNVLRILLFVIALAILISLIIAFLGFLGITNAFSEDNPACTRGYCKHFSDSTKEDLGATTLTQNGILYNVEVYFQTKFGPVEGWFLTLAMIPVAILLCIIVLTNKFPIPVDSVGSGEAL